jgi:hypothetical protein
MATAFSSFFSKGNPMRKILILIATVASTLLLPGVATKAATATTLRQRLLASQVFQSHSCLERR